MRVLFLLEIEATPDRRVVGRLIEAARLAVDLAITEAIGGLGREQQVVDAQALVALPAARLIIPEGIAMGIGTACAKGVGIAEIDDRAEMRPAFRLAQGVLRPAGRVID